MFRVGRRYAPGRQNSAPFHPAALPEGAKWVASGRRHYRADSFSRCVHSGAVMPSFLFFEPVFRGAGRPTEEVGAGQPVFFIFFFEDCQ